MELDSESKERNSNRKTRRRRNRNICLGVIAAVLVLALILLILGLTVFKAKRPVTTVNSVSLKNFDLNLDILRLRVNLNLTLDVHLSVKNPNRVGFKFNNSTALLKYRGEIVGEVPIPAGKINADGTSNMNLTLTLLADRLLSNSNLYSDVIAGALPLSTYTRISGKPESSNKHVLENGVEGERMDCSKQQENKNRSQAKAERKKGKEKEEESVET
ncbi:hypothetical protein LguiA_031990 [Lonicera macranthoides]